jgi:dTMP kinase
MFIVLDGVDASGKNTQTWELSRWFESKGYDHAVFSFHRYGTTLGQAIDRHLKQHTAMIELGSGLRAPEDALVFQCLAHADKSDAAHLIRKRLDEGKIVICDRWWQSGYAYGCADGLDPEWLLSISSLLPQADHNFYIEVPEEEALRRRPVLRDRYEKDRAKQVQVRGFYKSLWESKREEPGWHTIDGTGSVEQVLERITSRLKI